MVSLFIVVVSFKLTTLLEVYGLVDITPAEKQLDTH